MFYSLLAFLTVAGTIIHFNDRLRALMAQRIKIVNPLKRKNPPKIISLGEMIVIASIAGFMIYWICYWSIRNGRVSDQSKSHVLPDVCCNSALNTSSTSGSCVTHDNHPHVQTWARVFGHISSMLFTLVFIPVSRYSLVESVFGISYERAIKV